MVDIIQLGKTAKNVLDIFTSVGKNVEDIDETKAEKMFLNYSFGPESLSGTLRNTIIEPEIIVHESLKGQSVTEDIIKVNIDIFASYYMQVFKMLTNLNGLSAGLTLDILNPSTKSISIEDNNKAISLEDFDILPTKKVSLEKKPKISEITNNISDLYTKELELEIYTKETEDKKSVKITLPITIKSRVKYVSTKSIVNVVEPRNADKSFSSRVEDYSAGAIGLINLILANDLVKEYKKNKIKDVDDLLTEISNRERSAVDTFARKGLKGLNSYYAVYIIPKDVIASVEAFLSGKIRKEKYKNEFFDATKSMLLTITDDDHEMVEIHTKDISGSSVMSFKQLNNRKEKGSELSDILKLLLANKSPF